MKITSVLHKPKSFASRSGLHPLAEELDADLLYYDADYERIMRISWTVGSWVRKWGCKYYGSTWNSLIPWWGEWKLLRELRMPVDVLHFLWGEFASPRLRDKFGREAHLIIGTFHASARRLPTVLKGFKCLTNYDGITLMSQTQMPYFLEQGVDPESMQVILHGVDSAHFRLPEKRGREDADEPLQCLMVGSTERDHAMMRSVLEKIPKDIVEVTILTAAEQRAYYYGGLSSELATFPDRLDDAGLLHAYQQADLLLMPMLDCTANNAILESMACGTPVMVNRVGGVSEYVEADSNIIIEDHSIDHWIDQLLFWRQHKERLTAMRPKTRSWAEQFDWSLIAPQYLTFYASIMAKQGERP